MKLEIEFVNRADLEQQLSDLLGGAEIPVTVMTDEQADAILEKASVPTESGSTGTNTKTKTTKKKKKTPDPEPETSGEDEADDLPEDEDKGDSKNEGMMSEAITLLMDAFGSGKKDHVMALLGEYGVEKFSEIDLKHAKALLKEAKRISGVK